MNKKLIFSVLLSMGSSAHALKSIRNVDMEDYLLKTKYSDCAMDGINTAMEYADLTGDKEEEILIHGRSCKAGSGGDDIELVYEMGLDGNPKSVKLETRNLKVYDVLFGPVSSAFAVEGGKLIIRYTDGTERINPLEIKYKYENGQLRIDKVNMAPSYLTSFDCSKAAKTHDKVVCYIEKLAKLDLELAKAFEQKLSVSSAKERKKLKANEKNWLADRNKCEISRAGLECMEAAYQKRIEKLRKLAP